MNYTEEVREACITIGFILNGFLFFYLLDELLFGFVLNQPFLIVGIMITYIARIRYGKA